MCSNLVVSVLHVVDSGIPPRFPLHDHPHNAGLVASRLRPGGEQNALMLVKEQKHGPFSKDLLVNANWAATRLEEEPLRPYNFVGLVRWCL